MPKIKTHKGAKKRFQITKTGKVKVRHANSSHNFEHKSQDSKRAFRGVQDVSAADQKTVRKLLPYS
jgi:large subunit ribosomal protein L35